MLQEKYFVSEYFMYQSLCFKGDFLSWFISWLSIFFSYLV